MLANRLGELASGHEALSDEHTNLLNEIDLIVVSPLTRALQTPFGEEKWSFEHDDHNTEYGEWRPNGRNQTYACPGEPQHIFDSRMEKLYKWIEDRDESTIVVICHWGVIDSLCRLWKNPV